MSGGVNVDTARLPALLAQLRLPTIARLWPAMAETADREGWPAARTLAALLEHEIAERAQRRTARHLLEARLPPGKTLDSFDFNAAASLGMPCPWTKRPSGTSTTRRWHWTCTAGWHTGSTLCAPTSRSAGRRSPGSRGRHQAQEALQARLHGESCLGPGGLPRCPRGSDGDRPHTKAVAPACQEAAEARLTPALGGRGLRHGRVAIRGRQSPPHIHVFTVKSVFVEKA